MTQENKELLLKDLCGRLPYGVKVKTEGDDDSYALLSLHPNKNIAVIGLDMGGVYATSKVYIDNIIPYLRPMSSMTEDEARELGRITVENKSYYTLIDFMNPTHITFDWLNKNMFDYRGLISRGCAISTEKFNPYRKQ